MLHERSMGSGVSAGRAFVSTPEPQPSSGTNGTAAAVTPRTSQRVEHHLHARRMQRLAGASVRESPRRRDYISSMDALLASLIERLGRRAVKIAGSVMILICGLATLAFAIVLIVVLSQ